HGRGAQEQQQGDHRQVCAKSERRASLSPTACAQRRRNRRHTGSGRRFRLPRADNRFRSVFNAATGNDHPAINEEVMMNRRLLLVIAVVLVVAGIVAMNVLFIVDQTEQALVLQFGQPRRVIRDPGLWAKRPFLEDVRRYDNRLLDFEPPPEEVIVSDQKRLVVDTYTRYRITDPLLFYQTVNTQVVA